MSLFVISKLTRCRLLALLSGPVLGFAAVASGVLIAAATIGLIPTINPTALIALRVVLTCVPVVLLVAGLAAILGPYDLLVIVSCVIPALLYFGSTYSMNAHIYLPNNGHTMFDIAGGIPPFYWRGQLWLLTTALTWSVIIAGVGITLKRVLLRPKAGAFQAILGPGEKIRLRRGLAFDVVALFVVMTAILTVDVFGRLRLGDPEVIVQNTAQVLESPQSTTAERLSALSNLEGFSDRFSTENLRLETIAMLSQAMREQAPPVNLVAAAMLIDFNDISGLPMLEESLMHSPQADEPPPGGGWWLNFGNYLERIKDPAALPALVRLMKAPDAETRRGAVGGLRNIATPETIDPLITGLYDTDERVRFDSTCGIIIFLDRNRDRQGWVRPYPITTEGDVESLKAWAKTRPKP